MLAHRVIPILLKRGSALVKGERFNAWRSVGHVLQAAKIHQARGVDELIVLDIAATPAGRGPDFDAIAELTADCFMPITVGGGVRSVEDVRGLLSAGADKVAIGTSFDIIKDCSQRFGAQAIVAAMDVRGDRVWSHCGKQPIFGKEGRCYASGWPYNLSLMGAGEILLTSIDREGTMVGYDLDLIRAVSQAVDIPVIANGGCSGYEDMANAIRAGASAVAAGALFQFTDATPKEAARYLQEQGIEARV